MHMHLIVVSLLYFVRSVLNSNQAIQFPSHLQYLVLEENDAVLFGKKDFTIDLWIRTAPWPVGADPAIVSNKDWNSAEAQGFVIACAIDGEHLLVNVADGTCKSCRADWTTQTVVSDSQWHRVVVVFDRELSSPPMMWVYVDAKLDGVIELVDPIVNRPMGDFDLGVGNIRTRGYPLVLAQDGTTMYEHQYKGAIDEFRIWRRALSTAEIESTMSLTSQQGLQDYKGLVLRWTFDYASHYFISQLKAETSDVEADVDMDELYNSTLSITLTPERSATLDYDNILEAVVANSTSKFEAQQSGEAGNIRVHVYIPGSCYIPHYCDNKDTVRATYYNPTTHPVASWTPGVPIFDMPPTPTLTETEDFSLTETFSPTFTLETPLDIPTDGATAVYTIYLTNVNIFDLIDRPSIKLLIGTVVLVPPDAITVHLSKVVDMHINVNNTINSELFARTPLLWQVDFSVHSADYSNEVVYNEVSRNLTQPGTVFPEVMNLLTVQSSMQYLQGDVCISPKCNDHGCLKNQQCECFHDYASGWWTGTSCEECLMGFNGEQCNLPLYYIILDLTLDVRLFSRISDYTLRDVVSKVMEISVTNTLLYNTDEVFAAQTELGGGFILPDTTDGHSLQTYYDLPPLQIALVGMEHQAADATLSKLRSFFNSQHQSDTAAVLGAAATITTMSNGTQHIIHHPTCDGHTSTNWTEECEEACGMRSVGGCVLAENLCTCYDDDVHGHFGGDNCSVCMAGYSGDCTIPAKVWLLTTNPTILQTWETAVPLLVRYISKVLSVEDHHIRVFSGNYRPPFPNTYYAHFVGLSEERVDELVTAFAHSVRGGLTALSDLNIITFSYQTRATTGGGGSEIDKTTVVEVVWGEGISKGVSDDGEEEECRSAMSTVGALALGAAFGCCFCTSSVLAALHVGKCKRNNRGSVEVQPDVLFSRMETSSFPVTATHPPSPKNRHTESDNNPSQTIMHTTTILQQPNTHISSPPPPLIPVIESTQPSPPPLPTPDLNYNEGNDDNRASTTVHQGSIDGGGGPNNNNEDAAISITQSVRSDVPTTLALVDETPGPPLNVVRSASIQLVDEDEKSPHYRSPPPETFGAPEPSVTVADISTPQNDITINMNENKAESKVVKTEEQKFNIIHTQQQQSNAAERTIVAKKIQHQETVIISNTTNSTTNNNNAGDSTKRIDEQQQHQPGDTNNDTPSSLPQPTAADNTADTEKNTTLENKPTEDETGGRKEEDNGNKEDDKSSLPPVSKGRETEDEFPPEEVLLNNTVTDPGFPPAEDGSISISLLSPSKGDKQPDNATVGVDDVPSPFKDIEPVSLGSPQQSSPLKEEEEATSNVASSMQGHKDTA